MKTALTMAILVVFMLLAIEEYVQHQQHQEIKKKYLFVLKHQVKQNVKLDFSIYFPILMKEAKTWHLKPMQMIPLQNHFSLTLKGKYQYFIEWLKVIQKRFPELKWKQISMEYIPKQGLIYEIKGQV